MQENPITPMPSYHLSNIPEFEAIPVENWVAGDSAAREVLNQVWPTVASEDKRTEVIEFLQTLLDSYDNPIIKVCPYGSVPLKAYLPHGDIDLTVVGPVDKKYNLSGHVLELLEGAKQKESTIFKITEINFIDAAEVKLIKCIVDGITVDLSLNQLGGLCSLGFLELADTLIKKDHIFKRSIILIKGWFFYDSRLLGASHGLISTYALEILILYIFCMYYDSLTDPLMVMYRFLEYYGQFDWDHYCISIYGPVEQSSMANVTAVNPMNRCLLGGESLRDYISTYRVPDFIHLNPKIPTFPLRPMNIIDPLKESNNLGRSVSIGNFFRIRGALRLAALRLGEIMLLPTENVGEGIKKFFEGTFSNSQLSPVETSWASAPQDKTQYRPNGSNGSKSEAVDKDPSDGSNGYHDESEEGKSNGDDLDHCESQTNGFSTVGDESDSDYCYYEYVSENEKAANKYPADISDDEMVLESAIPDENEISLNLTDLTGDYDNHIRTLLCGLDYHRFMFHWDALWNHEPLYSFTMLWYEAAISMASALKGDSGGSESSDEAALNEV
ncbi:polymerase, nucleotidyl transferase domain-containing protein [Artemisia annua]|uniref:Polymerase, nucleotidyl transferase domain-containing protein n=1 Tax=Artemisia annua TaxID=35608 RepID=A0A2U1LT35_ARTAN|nr:polymerase, nucleotidyl transferase domain-containing protein [Artemisia annua]